MDLRFHDPSLPRLRYVSISRSSRGGWRKNTFGSTIAMAPSDMRRQASSSASGDRAWNTGWGPTNWAGIGESMTGGDDR